MEAQNYVWQLSEILRLNGANQITKRPVASLREFAKWSYPEWMRVPLLVKWHLALSNAVENLMISISSPFTFAGNSQLIDMYIYTRMLHCIGYSHGHCLVVCVSLIFVSIAIVHFSG